MSWEAVKWATEQRMKLPQEQLVLIMLANCADADGVTFNWWKNREHWWTYLIERTRLSRSSLFRHINTIEKLGLCTRTPVVMADGARRPKICLDLKANFDIGEEADKARYVDLGRAPESDGETESHGETGSISSANDDENASEINDYSPKIQPEQDESHGETRESESHGETEPVPPVGLHIESKLESYISPLPPSGGTSIADDGFEDFRKAWLRPIEKLSIARAVWAKIPTVKRGEATTAARGYFAYLATLRKPAVLSAQSFLRDIAGWPQWLRYAPDGDVPLASSMFAAESPEGKAIMVLYEIAAKADFVRQVMMRGGAISYARSVTPRLLALAQAGPKDAWPVLDHRQAASWEHLLREAVTVQVRKHLRAGDRAPWPWPPSIDGKLYTDSTGPPESLMTDDDYAALK